MCVKAMVSNINFHTKIFIYINSVYKYKNIFDRVGERESESESGYSDRVEKRKMSNQPYTHKYTYAYVYVYICSV